MDLAFRLIYGTACRSTHHKFAMDALPRLTAAGAEDWQRVFLCYYKDYLRGAKDPDDRFRDFKNHVLHVREGNWGGAIEACVKWYRVARQALQDQDWAHAAYSCGVLSHYVTDPVMPFHTGQHEKEADIHRACEWSINQSYDELLRTMLVRQGYPACELPTGEDWLSDAVIMGAEFGHQYYDALLEHYNFDRAVKKPSAGLGPTCRDALMSLFGFTIQHWANILSRLLTDSGVVAPEAQLAVPVIVASLEAPFHFVVRSITDSQERELVERIYEEWKSTGKVEKHLPLDDRTIDRLYQQEVLSGDWAESCRLREAAGRPRIAKPLPAAMPRQEQPQSETPSDQEELEERAGATRKRNRNKQRRSKIIRDIAGKVRDGAKQTSRVVRRSTRKRSASNELTNEVQSSSLPEEKSTERSPDLESIQFISSTRTEQPEDFTPESVVTDSPSIEASEIGDAHRLTSERLSPTNDLNNGDRFYLEPSDPVERAPGVGSKTARRLRTANVVTVEDLLNADPDHLANEVPAKYVDAQQVVDWQDQARLVCRVPGLRGHDAQLLVACDYRSPGRIADCDPDGLLYEIDGFARTGEGQSILRSNPQPDKSEISRWIESAKNSRRLRAA